MEAKRNAVSSESVLDPSCPWKLPRLKWEFRKYPYKMTSTEWKALLARAEQGDVEAQCYVAAMFEYGCRNRSGRILVRRSVPRVFEWTRRSAELGSASSQNQLGVILSARGATEANRREAVLWLKRAFRGGDSSAANNLAITYRENGDLRRAVLWFGKAVASKDDDGAYVQLGIHYYWGRGVRPDHEAAVRCFRNAIKGKNIVEAQRDDAFFYLGIAYLEGKGVRPSPRIAQKLLERANKDNDHPSASRLLNRMIKSSTDRKDL
jgi:TPR repeat protein